MTVTSDYQRWGQVHRHATTESFAETLLLQSSDAVHAFRLDDHVTLDVLVHGSPGARDRSIPVFFNGNVPTREQKSGPFFSGGRIGPSLSPVTIAFSDPAVDRSVDVPLGWYAGYEGAEVTTLILDVLRAISDAWGQELVLIGGSGGGFASLRFASLLDRPVSAFVWNPQTDILAYNRTFVDRYLNASFPSWSTGQAPAADWLADRRELCGQVGLDYSLVSGDLHSPGTINRLVYLQNIHDWHLAAHATPYLKHHGFWDLGTGSHVLDPEHVFQVGDWGEGHAPLPHDLVASALDQFLDGRTPSLEIARAVALDDSCDSTSLARAPKDLRGISSRFIPGATAAHDPWLPVVTVDLPDEAPAPGYGGLRFGLVQTADGRRGQLAWFKEKGRLEYTPNLRWDGSVLSVTMRDGMNNHLGEIPVSGGRATTTAKKAAPVAAKAFIYGSCVTRDAFNFDGLPKLSDYYSRTPIISAFGKPPAELPEGMDIESIPSAFQRRMVTRDVQKGVIPALKNLAPEDVVILDLANERIPVVRIGGGVLARSSEAVRAGLNVRGRTRLAIGDPGFMAAWETAADQLVASLQGRTVILNKAFGAFRDETGADIRDKFPVELHNECLRPMYERLQDGLRCEVVEYPEELIVANNQHRWGLTPFHYIDALYEHFVARIQQILR